MTIRYTQIRVFIMFILECTGQYLNVYVLATQRALKALCDTL